MTEETISSSPVQAQVEDRAGASRHIGLGGARRGTDKYHVPAIFY